MISLQSLDFDRLSFWIGFGAGLLFFLVLVSLRKNLPTFFGWIKQRFQDLYESLTESIDERYRNDVVRYAQRQHLTSAFFSLDEIAIEPRLIAPPPQSWHPTSHPVDILQSPIPYTPDWPELAAVYRAPTISLAEAMQAGANVVILGHPGSGKSFALAWLATRIGLKDPCIASLQDYLPIFFNASDLPDVHTPNEPGKQDEDNSPSFLLSQEKGGNSRSHSELLATIVSRYASPLTLPRLPALIQTSLARSQAILIIDGLDELPPNRFDRVVELLKQLLSSYPGNRIVTTASFDYIGAVTSLGLFPLALANWGDDSKWNFVEKWNQQWDTLIQLNHQISNKSKIETRFVPNWLSSKGLPTTPFYLTLKVWSAYAEDILGVSQSNLIETYIKRLTTGMPEARVALEQIAIQVVHNQNFRISVQEATRIISRVDKKNPTNPHNTDHPQPVAVKHHTTQSRGRPTLTSLVNSGILISLDDSQISFAHTIIPGYLAGYQSIPFSDLSPILKQSDWIGKSLMLGYLSSRSDISPIVIDSINNDNFLHHRLIQTAHWLLLESSNGPWRSIILRALANELNKGTSSLTLNAKMMAAIALSGDPGGAILIRKLIKSENIVTCHLACLGCGLIRDTKSIQDLSRFIEGGNPELARAACMALAEIGGKNALELLASSLRDGSETGRRAAAAALANHPAEGYALLEAGSRSDNLLMRRAVIYGLARINQEWSRKILQTMQLEDKEWIVRATAAQAMEEITIPNPYIPHPIQPADESPWLIEFAARHGQGVLPGEKSHPLVLEVLESGTENERLAALEYLCLSNKVESASYIKNLYLHGSYELREAAYQVLWSFNTAGVELPAPE